MNSYIYFEGSRKCKNAIDSIINMYHLRLGFEDNNEKIYKSEQILLSFKSRVGFICVYNVADMQIVAKLKELLFSEGKKR